MSKTTEIREICGDYAFDVEYSKDFVFTMFFNSLRNAKTVKRCIEVDDSVPNTAVAVDFVEVVRCKDCRCWEKIGIDPITNYTFGYCRHYQWQDEENSRETNGQDYCSYGERRKENVNRN